ncbi:hypothetical protein U1Q18_022794, partial [Sarracenia purpurea var. burkii]
GFRRFHHFNLLPKKKKKETTSQIYTFPDLEFLAVWGHPNPRFTMLEKLCPSILRTDLTTEMSVLAPSYLVTRHSWCPQLHLSTLRILGIFGVDGFSAMSIEGVVVGSTLLAQVSSRAKRNVESQEERRDRTTIVRKSLEQIVHTDDAK